MNSLLSFVIYEEHRARNHRSLDKTASTAYNTIDRLNIIAQLEHFATTQND